MTDIVTIAVGVAVGELIFASTVSLIQGFLRKRVAKKRQAELREFSEFMLSKLAETEGEVPAEAEA